MAFPAPLRAIVQYTKTNSPRGVVPRGESIRSDAGTRSVSRGLILPGACAIGRVLRILRVSSGGVVLGLRLLFGLGLRLLGELLVGGGEAAAGHEARGDELGGHAGVHLGLID